MHLKIKSLELSRFRSYVEPAGVLFPETGLVLVRGNGSGAGKSSLFMAIYDAIGICPVPATQLKSWHGDGCRRVSLQLAADDKDIVIRRGETQSLTIDGSEKAMETLPSVLGVKDLEWLLPLTYRPQNGGSFFLSLGDAEKKSFLSGVLGLDALEKAFDESQEKTPKLQAAKETAAMRVASITGSLQQAKTQLGDGVASIDDLDAAQDAVRIASEAARQAVEHAAAAVAAKSAEISALQKQPLQLTPEVQEQVAALRAPLPADPLVAQFESRLKAVDQQEAAAKKEWSTANAAYMQATQAWSSASTKLAKAEADLAALRRQEQTKAEELQSLMSGVCPTCHQAWHDHEEESDRTSSLDALRKRIAAQEAVVAEMSVMQEKPQPPPQPDLSQLQKMRTALRQRYEQLQLTQRQKALENSAAADALVATARVDVDRRLSALTAERAEAQEKLTQARADAGVVEHRKSLVALIARHQSDLAQAQSALDQALGDMKAEDDFRALIGPKGFLGAIFDEVLEEISGETNRLLALMPNVAHVSLQLSSTKTSATSKKQQKVISPVFRSHGHEITGAWMRVFSGGQVTAIQLALDLAVAQVLGRRTGLEAGWLILDEPFVGLPAAETEQVMEVLRLLAENRLLLVVDHGTEAQQMFSQTIEVVNENGRSRIQ